MYSPEEFTQKSVLKRRNPLLAKVKKGKNVKDPSSEQWSAVKNLSLYGKIFSKSSVNGGQDIEDKV